MELRVARKFKEVDDIREDEETRDFLETTLGVRTGSQRDQDGGQGGDGNFYLEEEDDEEDDDDFDQEEEGTDDCDSLEEDDDEDERLGRDTIGKDELDALSVTSAIGSEDDDHTSSSDREDGDGEAPRRRSRRKRFTLLQEDATSGDESDECSGSSADKGRMDVRNILPGKRNRTKVDYRK